MQEFVNKHWKVLVGVFVALVLFFFVFPRVKEGFSGADDKKLVFNLASWCGHCTNLKNSGELEKIKNDPDVNVEINEDDKEADKKYGCEGFPCIKLAKGGAYQEYSGERTAKAFKEFFKGN